MVSLRRLSYIFLLLACAMLVLPGAALAQTLKPLTEKQAAAIWKMQELLDQPLIESQRLQKEMTLAQLLSLLEKQLAKEMKVVVRLDKEALPAKLLNVIVTPLPAPLDLKTRSTRSILEGINKKISPPIAYRLGAAEIELTSAEKALYTVAYDVHDLIAHGQIFPLVGRVHHSFQEDQGFRRAEPAQRAARLVRILEASRDLSDTRLSSTDRMRVEVRNSSQLVIRANAKEHAEIASLLRALRRLSDWSVIATAKLFAVDEALYNKIKNMKRLPLEEAERKFLDGIPTETDALFKPLRGRTTVLTGGEIRLAYGQLKSLLSLHQATSCLASPEMLVQGEKGRQTILEGVVFLAGVQISPDRRGVRVHLTERSTQLQEIQKLKAWDDFTRVKKVDAEIPLLLKSTQEQTLEIADGGSILVPVQYRPASLSDQGRWRVLSITVRIRMEEEEQMIRHDELEAVLPLLLADALTNPRLKALREFYGSSGKQRFALVDSKAWAWPKDFQPKIPGYQLSPAGGSSARLLGIRVEEYRSVETGDAANKITLSLANVGATKDGEVLGRGRLRYQARRDEKGWKVELAEPSSP